MFDYRSIGNRLKKLIVLIILVPLFLAVVSYYFENQNQSVYTAQTKINLGEFGDGDKYTQPSVAKSIILSNEFLNDISDRLPIEIEQIRENLSITSSDNTLTLSLSGLNSNSLKETLELINTAFISESNNKFREKQQFLAEKINTIKGSIAKEENSFEKQKFIYDLELKLMNMEQAIASDEISINGIHPAPVRQAILGLLIGIFISGLILIVPEILKPNSNKVDINI